jgi:hypothetical protein
MSSAEHAATGTTSDTGSATHSGPNRQAIVAAVLNPTSAAPVCQASNWTTGLSHTVGSGSNRLLLFAVGYENDSDPGVASVSYGGQALTRINGTVAGPTVFDRVELWYLNEAGIAAASATTFSVTWGGGTPADPMYAAASFRYVDQTSPIANSSTNSTNSGSPNPLTTSVSVTADAMAVAGAVAGNSGSYTWNNGWTEGADQAPGGGASVTMSSAQHPATSTTSDSASATHSGPNRQAIVAAVLRPD